MKKVLYLFLFLLTVFAFATPFASHANATPQQVRVIFNQTRIYSTTNLSTFSTAQELEQVTILKASLHQVFEVLGEETNFYLVQANQTTQGYVQKIAVIDNAISSPQVYLQTNGVTLAKTTVYEKLNNTYLAQETISIPTGTRVRILSGYDKSQEYTLVSFEQDEQIYSYYVKTAMVDPDGMDRSILLAVSLIFIALSIGSILMKMLNPKKKNKKKIS